MHCAHRCASGSHSKNDALASRRPNRLLLGGGPDIDMCTGQHLQLRLDAPCLLERDRGGPPQRAAEEATLHPLGVGRRCASPPSRTRCSSLQQRASRRRTGTLGPRSPRPAAERLRGRAAVRAPQAKQNLLKYHFHVCRGDPSALMHVTLVTAAAVARRTQAPHDIARPRSHGIPMQGGNSRCVSGSESRNRGRCPFPMASSSSPSSVAATGLGRHIVSHNLCTTLRKGLQEPSSPHASARGVH